MNGPFYVIGGQYSDMNFRQLVQGTTRVDGPYETYEEANQAWRTHADESRSDACVRYTIVSCATAPRRQQQMRAA